MHVDAGRDGDNRAGTQLRIINPARSVRFILHLTGTLQLLTGPPN
jgi:hypothetical protein